MINEVRNSTGFTNFAAAKKLKARAPYSSKFQPLEAEVEAVSKADGVEPYSVEQSLRAFDEPEERSQFSQPDTWNDNADNDDQLGAELANVDTSEQTKLYTSTGPMASSEAPDETSDSDDQLDDKSIVETVVNNISEKIEKSFNALEMDIANAIELRLGQTLLDVFKQQLAEETSEKLKQSIVSIVAKRDNARVNIAGPRELIELFQSHLTEEETDKASLSFSIDETSSDLTVQIDEVSIISRFAELDDLVSELFE